MSEPKDATTATEGKPSRGAFDTLAPRSMGFGAVPGTPEEARSHVQLRVRTYVGLFAMLWTIVFVTQLGIRQLGGSDLVRNAARPSIILMHCGACLVLFATWFFLAHPRSLRTIDVADAFATKVQVFTLAAMLYSGGEPRYRTELAIMLALTNILAGRAALVPCTFGRTAVFSFFAVLPQPIVTYLVYATKPLPPEFPNAIEAASFVLIWGALAALLAVFITRIIYGLERRVKEATQLGQYTLESQVGAGGMGMVYLARHSLLRRPTAIKLLPPDKAGKDAIKRFEREVQLTSQLTHPNVVAIYDYGRTPEGVFYYAMEYLEGVDLERLVKKQGRLPPARVKHVLRQAADALAEAHSVGLIHRDIKPANIILLSRGRQHDYVKVLDFGLVKELRADKMAPSLSNVATLIGTPLYISPESITDPKKVDHRTDIYALGAVAYFLLTGAPAVKGKTLVEVCAWHMYEKPEPPSARIGKPIPASLEKIILQCLEKDPAARPQSAAEIVEALDAATDIPTWSAAEAVAAWADKPGTVSISTRDEGPAGSEDGADVHTPMPGSRALPVDMQNR